MLAEGRSIRTTEVASGGGGGVGESLLDWEWLASYSIYPPWSSRGSDWQAELCDKGHYGVRLVLLFSGVAPVPFSSPWFIFRLGWPLALGMGIPVEVANVMDESSASVTFAIHLPLLFAIITSLSCYAWLWPRAERILFQENLPSPAKLKVISFRSGAFIVANVVVGLVAFLAHLEMGTLSQVVYFGGIEYKWIGWIFMFATIPVLGATLLILGIDTRHTVDAAKQLILGVKEKTLTREHYLEVRDQTRARCRLWNRSLGTLATVAAYNTIGLLYMLHSDYEASKFASHYVHTSSSSHSSGRGGAKYNSALLIEVHHVIVLGKETTLLLMIIFLIAHANNYVDSVSSVLSAERWGKDPRSKEESNRRDLLLLVRSRSVTPEAAESFRILLTSSRSSPIAWRVLGIRPTADLFVTSIFSSFIAVVIPVMVTAFRNPS